MKCVKGEHFSQLQQNPKNIRNICIMAHVDHGKTTLADSLIASNGVISKKLAGKLRYLDSREDEQQRGITMKSSAIALHHQKDDEDYLINVIDSPGHVDFSNEVSTAVRLCDGAIILIDVVEGVCPQTKVSLRQAWIEGIKPILVLNKIDRLISEKKLTPLDAYIHLQQTLERVNAFIGELFASEILGKVSIQNSNSSPTSVEKEVKLETVYDWSSGLEDTDDSHVYFSPDQGNVIFACALHGWGFGISQFARIYSEKLGVKENILLKTLWGDYYLNNKTKRIVKGAQVKAKKPLFVQFILENIWSVYEAVVERRNQEMIEKIISSLKLDIKPRDLRYNDPQILLQLIFSQWLPLSNSALDMVCDKLPNPTEITQERCEKLMCAHLQRFDSLPEETQSLKKYFTSCSADDDVPVIVFISKMFAAEKSSLPKFKQKPLTLEEMKLRREKAQKMKLAAQQLLIEENKDKGDGSELNQTEQESSKDDAPPENNDDEDKVDANIFIAFARVFSGTLRKGQRVYVLGPKHNPQITLENTKKGILVDETSTLKDLKVDQHVTSFEVNDLYLLMGRELELLTEVPAGNVVGIGNLEEHVLKSATLSTSLACPSFTDLHVHSPPIVRVALEPVHTADMPALVRGLKLLNQADAAVHVRIQETGEHVIITAGEVHLQRCLDDLRKNFAKVDIVASKPIVPFRETIIEPPKTDMVNEIIEDRNQFIKNNNKLSTKDDDPNLITLQTPNKKCTLKIRAIPLPENVTTLLDSHVDILKALDQSSTTSSQTHLTDETLHAIDQFQTQLDESFKTSGSSWTNTINEIVSFGPRREGPNILICRVPDYKRPLIWKNDKNWLESSAAKSERNLISGFQLATLAGPLCEEPMRGVCFVLEGFDVESAEVSDDVVVGDPYGPFSGQLMSTMKEGCRRAFQTQPQRLMAAMYTCNILVRTEVLGKMYALLGKRNGQVLSSDLVEGSQVFNVTATLPVIESFDFANEIRKQTSGHAMPQLVFTHWEVVDVDPFWVPTTEEEYAHFGEKADSENRSKRYMNAVRRRKGLAVDDKIVEHAEKQRTLTRNK